VADRCAPVSVELIEESSQAWTEAVLEQLRMARYQPARKAGPPVRQLAYQVFTYHSDGWLQKPR